MKKQKQDLGICVRCKKKKAVMTYADSVLSWGHGFSENICKGCYDIIMKKSSWYRAGFKDGHKKALDDNNILYGKDAKRFLENMKKTEEEAKNDKRKKNDKT